MKRLTIFLLFNLIIGKAFSTAQVNDILIWNQDTLYLYESPLEQIPDISKKISDIKPASGGSSDCWRGYYAEWKLIGNELFLFNLYECNSNINLNHTIEKILGRKFKNGLLRANWVEGNVWCGYNLISDISFCLSCYNHEYNLIFNKGIKKSIQEFHPKPCDPLTLENMNDFFIENLDWDHLSLLKNRSFSITAYVFLDRNGRAYEVKITESSVPVYEGEFIRVIKLYPCISTVYFYKGKPDRRGIKIKIDIDEKKTKKYGFQLVQ